MSHKCGFTGGQEGWCHKRETRGRRNHTECWKHPHPANHPVCRREEEEAGGGESVGRPVDFVWWLSEDVVGQVTDGGSSSKRRDACWGLRMGVQWGKFVGEGWGALFPNWHWTWSFIPSPLPLSLQQSTSETAMAFNPERENKTASNKLKKSFNILGKRRIYFLAEC